MSRKNLNKNTDPQPGGGDPKADPDYGAFHRPSCGSDGADPVAAYVDRLAVTIVASAISASETLEQDATLGAFSELASILRSVVTRVGQAIPDLIAKALEQDPRFTVLREYPLPLTRAAAEVVDNNRRLSLVELKHDLHQTGTYATDLVVIDDETRHASILECRRGGVVFSGPRIAAILRTLRIATLTARKALEADGYRVSRVGCGVIDRYGRAGYDPEMTIGPDAIDLAFGVPVLAYLDRLDERIRKEIRRRSGPMLAGLLPEPEPEPEPEPKPCPACSGQAVADAKDPQEEGSEVEESGPAPDDAAEPLHLELSRFVGPAELRRDAAVRRMRPASTGRLQ
ncbi:hypothetical protein [Jiella sp. M17.18]|uniref:hypothetical protein n=1 Tax=Jiella sp. M17.18 TaxID=3234247 RepID=UPI0034DF05A7